MENKEKWYGDAMKYWKDISPSDEGMLGGYQKISDVDAKGSRQFIKRLKHEKILTSSCHRALDCGAGIGRVSKKFLLKSFDVVDMVEQQPEFTRQIQEYMGEDYSKVENVYTIGMQDFEPKNNHYDVVWIQWVIGHLADEDFVDFLKKCEKALVPGGCICIKDNVAARNCIFDADDSSVTRNHSSFLALFKRTGLALRITEKQTGLPSQLFKVNTYALTAPTSPDTTDVI